MALTAFILSTCPPWLALLGVAVLLHWCGQTRVTFLPLVLAVIIGIADNAIDIYVRQAASLLHTGLAWNWFGKLSSVFFCLILVAWLPQLSRQETGLVWKQKSGSLKPAFIAIALLTLFAIVNSLLEAPDLNVESLLFEATVPGLDEELFIRGVVLALLLQGFHDRQQVFGATIGPSVFITSAIFGAWHGFYYAHGGFHFHIYPFLVTGLVGFGLAYIRQRTGSLLLPVIAHNSFNLILFLLPVLWCPGPWRADG